MRYVWDENKSRRNLAKHKLSFETASLVFDDPNALNLHDRTVNGEERWLTLGLAGGIVILLVAHTDYEEDDDEVIRYQRGARLRAKGECMKRASRKQEKELKALSTLPDDKIDLSDIPEVRDWRRAVVGKFYRPIKKSLTVRLDADVLAWLKARGRGYQTRINQLLRAAMEDQSRHRRA